MQIKATYQRGTGDLPNVRGDKVFVKLHAPREVCMKLDELITKFLDDEGFEET